MPPRHDKLIARIADFRNLLEASRAAARGKRSKVAVASFLVDLEKNLVRLNWELLDGSWVGGGYRAFEVRDPKPRRVSAAPFRDRVVHHALCRVIEPIFDRGFVFDSYANRRGKGTHAAVRRFEVFRDRHPQVLRCDIWRYFPAVDHEVLKADLRRRIACEDTLRLLDTLIDGSNPQEPVNLYFPGDDLFTPFARRRGLPLGNLTSQFFANVYLDPLDHFVKEVLRAPGYVRYVDDFAVFGDDVRQLEKWRARIEAFLARRRLALHPRKTRIRATCEPARFLGYVLLPDGGRRLPEDNVNRFRGRLQGLRDRYRARTVGIDEVKERVDSWIAHARHADTWRLRRTLFRGGMFDPAREPDRPF